MDVKGKGAFVTGGVKGIGRAIVLSLLDNGAKVLFCDVNSEAGKTAEAELQKQYGVDQVVFALCDVSNASQLQEAFERAVSSFGAVEVCINNAGILAEHEMERTMAVNAIGSIRGSQLALDHMRRDRGGLGGAIINIASLLGLTPLPACPVYAASKHAIIGFTQSWASNARAGEIGVRWSCVCPDMVDTDMLPVEGVETMLDQAGVLATIRATVLLRPSDVAEAVMRLLRDKSSNGALSHVNTTHPGGRYKKRQLVDVEGESDPQPAENPVPVP